MELLPCPFCGAKAILRVEEEKFQLVGCSATLVMLCPNPSQVIYKRDGRWDYSSWNKRYIAG